MSQVVGQREHRKADGGRARGGAETCTGFASVSPQQLPGAGSLRDEDRWRWPPRHPLLGAKAGLLG